MMNRITFLIYIFLLFQSENLFAQWYDPDKVSKKIAAINQKAYEAAMDGDYAASMKLLSDAIAADNRFVEGYLSRAGIYATYKNYEASVKDFETALQLDPVFSNTYLLPYSISLAGSGQFDKALVAVNKFLENPALNVQSRGSGEYRKKTYEFAVNYAKEHPVNDYIFSLKNVSPKINSEALEYFPSITIDGKKMIFTRRIKGDEDLYESEFLNGEWTEAKPLAGMINTNLGEAAQNVSQDGTMMVFTGCDYPEGAGSCDIYFSYKTNKGGWTEPENMGAPINTEAWESSPSLSPDKKDIYFSSSRAGGYGGTDIYVSHKLTNGKWSRPQNLGPEINTSGSESCPFIHADNQTLYFNSDGHPGYGIKDLFVSHRTGDDWGKPVNLGYPVNTIDDESSLVVASDGRTGYYSSDKSDSRGGLDIYTFQLRKEIGALKTLWVNGKVFDKNTNNGLPSTVELTELNSQKVVSRLQTDEDGNYLVTLPEGKNYAFNVNRKGYLFYSENFSFENNMDSARVINIPLEPIEKGAEIVLRNIFFHSKESVLQPESFEELDRVVAILNENPKMQIEISGHTDNVGKPSDNLALSINRARSVVNYLVSKGIDQRRITFKGYGETKPIESNETEKGKSRNRRTELHVTAF